MNIYVGNLDFKVNENDLKSIFEPFGTVTEVKIITDKYTGKSKGFAFIIMENHKEASQAIEELNGTTLENRAITVNEARPRKQY
ncbi:MAG: RNA-binding protein [Bacteroidales bacterium]|nr:RNA-binding protein [Bacteroidales bacterium]